MSILTDVQNAVSIYDVVLGSVPLRWYRVPESAELSMGDGL